MGEIIYLIHIMTIRLATLGHSDMDTDLPLMDYKTVQKATILKVLMMIIRGKNTNTEFQIKWFASWPVVQPNGKTS